MKSKVRKVRNSPDCDGRGWYAVVFVGNGRHASDGRLLDCLRCHKRGVIGSNPR
jgi:hypothetical protein